MPSNPHHGPWTWLGEEWTRGWGLASRANGAVPGSLRGHRDNYVCGTCSCFWCLKGLKEDTRCWGVGWNVTQKRLIGTRAVGLEHRTGFGKVQGPPWKAGLESRGDFP